MTYNKRKAIVPLRTCRNDIPSPSFDSPLFNRTSSQREWTSPLVSDALRNRGDGRELTNIHQFMPPPPITNQAGRTSGTGYDMASRQGYASVADLNNAIPASPSPLAEARYACLGGDPARPYTSPGHHPPGGELTSSAAARSPPNASSSAGLPTPRTKPTYYDCCGTIVEERDPVTREVISRYRCGALLGTGGFAQVYELKELATNAHYAGKIIDRRVLMRKGSEPKLRMEIDIHSRVKHPNIVQFVRAFRDEYYYYILLEQCSKKNLMDLSKERGVFTVEEIQYIMLQLVTAVEYMHSNLIIHRDIKLGNVMIDFSGNMKIGDFGFASELVSPSDKKRTTCGTPNYIAPEVLAAEKKGPGYGLEADIWSLGVTLYALAFGTPPFETKDIHTTYDRIQRVHYSFPRGSSVPSSCRELIRWMLQKEPHQRPSPAQILQHSFLCAARQTLRSTPRSLLPPPPPPTPNSQATLSTSPNDRGSSLWASPIGVHSPFGYYDGSPVECPRSTLPRQEINKEGTDHGLQMTLHEFLKENDRINETASEVFYAPSCDKLNACRPYSPSVFLKSTVYCNKYGYGFLTHQDGKKYPVVLLNDKTKLIFDMDLDIVYYYGRSRVQTVTTGSGNRSPLLSEELATKGFRDELVVFHDASTTLARRNGDAGDGDNNNNHGNDIASRYKASAAKKMAITNFFLPFLERGTRDKRMVGITCVLNDWRHSWEKYLFAPKRSGNENVDIVYVKDAILESLHDLTGEYRESDIQLLVARMSDSSVHISVCCNGVPQPLFRPNYNALETFELNLPWRLDILVYGAFCAVMAMETNQSPWALSFCDIRRDTKTVKDGRVYFAAGSTTQIKSIMLPTALLRTITTLLRKTRCSNDIVNCFC